MTAKIDNGYISFHLFDDLFANMTLDEKRELATHLVWDYDVFKDVVNELCTGLATRSFNDHIFEARKELVARAPELHLSLVAGLLQMLEKERLESERHSKWAWQMYHSWPENEKYDHTKRPQMPEYIHANYTAAERTAKELLDILASEVSQ
jgi:hypothetical protein